MYCEGMTWLQRAGSVSSVRMGHSALSQHILGTQMLFTMKSRIGYYREALKWKGTKARTNSRPKGCRKMGVGIVYFWE